tara:strand:+ start:343 stop:561 length:219 start_codon:yes stop_codon:yes gene_type:complete
MSEELIYKVAEEIYLRLDDLKEQLVELKDTINLIERDSIIRERILFRLVRDNANELSELANLDYSPSLSQKK